MRSKQLRQWLIPSALAAVLVAALFISPALGGPGFLTTKKLKKKANATQLVVSGQKSLTTSGQVIGSLELRPGNYVLSSTFRVTRSEGGQIYCRLQIPGVAEDIVALSHDTPSLQEESAALQTAGRVPAARAAQLFCNKSPGITTAIVENIELTALRVPKLTVTPG